MERKQPLFHLVGTGLSCKADLWVELVQGCREKLYFIQQVLQIFIPVDTVSPLLFPAMVLLVCQVLVERMEQSSMLLLHGTDEQSVVWLPEEPQNQAGLLGNNGIVATGINILVGHVCLSGIPILC